MDPAALHTFFDVIAFIGVVGSAWAGLLIKNVLYEMKNTQATVKAELIESQTEIKEDLTAKHSENRQDLAEHLARDEEQFRAINKTLDRIEAKVDRNNGHT